MGKIHSTYIIMLVFCRILLSQTPLPPTSVTASDGTYPDRIRVTWNTVAGVSGYDIYRSESNNMSSAAKIASTSNSLLSMDDFSVSPARTYYYWVKSKVIINGTVYQSSFSSSDAGWLFVQTPNAPTGVSASKGTYSNKIKITWNAVSGISGYNIYKSESNTVASAVKIAWTSDSEMEDFNISVGKLYYYWVKTTIIVGGNITLSSFSTYDTGWLQTPTPEPPTGLTASNGEYSNKIHISWNSVSNVSGYDIYRNTSSNSATAAKIGSTSSAQLDMDDYSVNAGITYYYWVKSKIILNGNITQSTFSNPDAGWLLNNSSNINDKNVALSINGATASAISEGSYLGNTHYASMAIDGDVATDWASNNSMPAWIKIKFDKLYVINKVGIHISTHKQTFSISLSSDNINWIKVVQSKISTNEEGSGSYYETFTVANISAQYIKIDITSTSAPPSHIFQAIIDEIEAYNSDVKPDTYDSDLAVSMLSFIPIDIKQNEHPTAVSFSLKNNGPADMTASSTRIKASFYISQNQILGDGDDKKIGDNLYDITLASGASTTVNLSQLGLSYLIIPSDVSGDYFVFVKVEHSSPSILSDPDFNNNYTEATSAIHIEPLSTRGSSIKPITTNSVINKGTKFWLEIIVGDPIAVNDLYGISFKLSSDNSNCTYVDDSAVQGEFMGSQILFFPQKINEQTVDLAITKTQKPGSSGTGIVARLQYTSSSNLSSDQTITLALSDVTATNSNGNNIEMNPSSLTVVIKSVSTIDVWPGDCNNDKNINSGDIIPIGLYYGQTRPGSNNPGSNWQAYQREPWQADDSTPKRIYADANGDGTVNSADIMPIGLNYAKTHANFVVPETKSAASLKKSLSNASLKPVIDIPAKINTAFMVKIKIGDPDIVQNLFGISLKLHSNRSNCTYLDGSAENGGFLGSGASILFFPQKVDNQTVDIGLSKISGSGVDGSGILANAKFISTTDQTISFTLNDVSAVDANGNQILLNVESSDVIVNVESIDNIPTEFALSQNYPNPFNPLTTFHFQIPKRSYVVLSIYNSLGKEVMELINSEKEPGDYEVKFDGSELSSGVYLYRLQTDTQTFTKKMLLLK